MFTYALHLEHGSDVGQATYPSMVKPGEGPLVALLQVQPAQDS